MADTLNWQSNKGKDGPGTMAYTSHSNWKRDQNELTCTSTMSTEPESGFQLSTKLGYMRRDKDFSFWLRHSWFNLNAFGEGSSPTLGMTYNVNDKVTVATSAELQLDPEDGCTLDGNLHVGATWKACSKMSVTGKLSATKSYGDMDYNLGLHVNNKWVQAFETNFVIQANKDNLTSPQWGLNVSNNF